MASYLSEFQDRSGWQPVWWEVEVWPGSSWQWSATLHGATPGTVQGGELVVDGKRFPITADDDVVVASLTPDQVGGITDGAAAQLFVDVAGVGRVLWLHGKVIVGDHQ